MPAVQAWLAALLGLLQVACGTTSVPTLFALRGTILTPDTIVADGLLVVDRGRIRAVLDRPTALAGVPTVDTGGIILPGLIDLHNHVLWSVFPRWDAGGVFRSREEWLRGKPYLELYAGPERTLRRTMSCDMNRFGEARAIVGGVTSIQGSLRAACSAGLVRNLDHNPGFVQMPGGGVLTTLIDTDVLSADGAARLAERLRDGAAGRLFVHAAEGRADDPAPREEFARLVEYGLLTDRTVIVHGTGLGDAEFDTILRAGASLVWSPRSSIELYGETTSITMAIERGIPVALAPDWSITGSINLLDELRYASEWSRWNLGAALDDRELVRMATSVPAVIAGVEHHVGSLRAGLLADLLVIRGARRDPYRAVVMVRPSDVRLVMIGGEAVYGAAELMRLFRSRWDFEGLDICGARMALDTTSGRASLLDFRYRFSQTETRLRRAMAGINPGIELVPIVDCAA